MTTIRALLRIETDLPIFMRFDLLFFSQTQNLIGQNFWFDVVVIFFAKYLPYILIGLLFLLLLKDYKKYLDLVAVAVFSASLAGVITIIIRFFYYRPRPFALENIVPLFSHSVSASFPSLHAAFFFGLSFAILFYNKKTGAIFLAASFLIACSRVLAGLHWPSDILAGIVLGILCALAVIRVCSPPALCFGGHKNH